LPAEKLAFLLRKISNEIIEDSKGKIEKNHFASHLDGKIYNKFSFFQII